VGCPLMTILIQGRNWKRKVTYCAHRPWCSNCFLCVIHAGVPVLHQKTFKCICCVRARACIRAYMASPALIWALIWHFNEGDSPDQDVTMTKIGEAIFVGVAFDEPQGRPMGLRLCMFSHACSLLAIAGDIYLAFHVGHISLFLAAICRDSI
jgi:hypothetical protein